ncbi:MAG: YkvA family protein, partial [Spirochaetales bacterium]|nr:YkvA family protein [Spirochaetales bacterium]
MNKHAILKEPKKILKLSQNMAEKMGKEVLNKPNEINKIKEQLPKKLKGAVSGLKELITRLWEAFMSPETPLQLKLFIIGSLAYLVAPIDIIPDVLPGIGLLDDAQLLILAGQLLSPYIKKDTTKISYDKIVESIDPKIKALEKKIMLRSLIKLFMFTIGAILLKIFPANVIIFYVSSILIISSLLWTIAQWIINIAKHRKRIAKYIKITFEQKFKIDNIIKIIFEIELDNFQKNTQKSKGKTKKTVGQNFMMFLLKQWNNDNLLQTVIPTYDELKTLLIQHYKKNYIFHLIIFIVYLLLTIFILKPFLLNL